MSQLEPEVRLLFRDQEDWRVDRLLDLRAETHADIEYLQWELGDPVTFGEAASRVRRLAGQWRRIGVEQGEAVLIYQANTFAFLFMILSLQYIGAIPAPVNTNFRGRFFSNVGAKTEATVAVTSLELAPQLIACLPDLPGIRTIIVSDATAAQAEELDAGIGRAEVLPGEVIDASGPEEGPAPAMSYRDTALYLGTSGTTGASKSIIIPHAHLYFWAEQNASVYGLDKGDVMANMFPFFHGNALFKGMYPALARGAKAVLFERFSTSQWIERLRAVKATHTPLLGATMQWLADTPPKDDDADNDLRVLWCAPIEDRLEPIFRERFDIEHFVTAFGQSECTLPLVTPLGSNRPPRAVGRVVHEWWDAKLVDGETDMEVDVGQVGELIVRPKAPWIMSLGYQGDAAATARVSRNMWWHTGDGLVRDADGWFYNHGRTNDAMRVRGENVSADEVEAVILEHASVAACGVVGVPADEAGGEHEIAAFIIANGPIDLSDLLEYCRTALPKFAVPRYFEVIEELPINEMGKLQRAKLRERGVTTDTWDRARPDALVDQLTSASAPFRSDLSINE